MTINRAALVQSAHSCTHVALLSCLTGRPRIYALGVSDAYSTMMHPIDGDASATNVGTRALLDMIRDGRAGPCSALKMEA